MATEGRSEEYRPEATLSGKGEPSEAELIQAAAGGNVGAFARLVSRYRGRVLCTAYGVVGSAAEAEDVAQEVLVRVWRNLSEHRQKGAFAGWVYRITVNAAIDTLRERRPEVELKDTHGEPRASAEEIVLLRDEARRVRRAIEALPPNTRVTLILREYEQLSYKEIAQVLQIPIGTVMSRLSYARKLLKETLDSVEGDG
ncbi:MAG TPA: sigma-70 family RNA polymerase sigma factor [Chloroflexi bacterium]|jgi:RNA polymerase sigma-70 factor (ECF subfamily)|nr:sigma-70 family RNA polymerase sigma factor [Chloroflexota bacterium]